MKRLISNPETNMHWVTSQYLISREEEQCLPISFEIYIAQAFRFAQNWIQFAVCAYHFGKVWSTENFNIGCFQTLLDALEFIYLTSEQFPFPSLTRLKVFASRIYLKLWCRTGTFKIQLQLFPHSNFARVSN